MSVLYCPQCGDMFHDCNGVYLLAYPQIKFCSTACLDAELELSNIIRAHYRREVDKI